MVDVHEYRQVKVTYVEEVQAFVNKFINEGWTVAKINYPSCGFPGYIQFKRLKPVELGEPLYD